MRFYIGNRPGANERRVFFPKKNQSMKLYRIPLRDIQEHQYINHPDFAFGCFGYLFFTDRAAALQLDSDVVEIEEQP